MLQLLAAGWVAHGGGTGLPCHSAGLMEEEVCSFAAGRLLEINKIKLSQVALG